MLILLWVFLVGTEKFALPFHLWVVKRLGNIESHHKSPRRTSEILFQRHFRFVPFPPQSSVRNLPFSFVSPGEIHPWQVSVCQIILPDINPRTYRTTILRPKGFFSQSFVTWNRFSYLHNNSFRFESLIPVEVYEPFKSSSDNTRRSICDAPFGWDLLFTLCLTSKSNQQAL